MEPERRRKLMEELEAAVRAAKEAVASATDAVSTSRRTARAAKLVIRDTTLGSPPGDPLTEPGPELEG